MFRIGTKLLFIGLLLGVIDPQQSSVLLYERPSFIEQVPPEHYLGISIECQQLAEAKADSMQNVIKQIFQQIGAEYNLEFEKRTYAQDSQVGNTVRNRFSWNAAGILTDIEVKSSYYEKEKGKHICYTLVYFPEAKFIRARQLIEEENNKRLAQYDGFIGKGKFSEANGRIIDALNYYKMAFNQAKLLFKGKTIKGILVKSYIKNISSQIRLATVSNYNQRNRHCVICKVLYNGKPVSDIPVRFQLTEGEGFITPVSCSNSDGFVQSDVNASEERPNNKIRAWIDIEGINSGVVFNFSSVGPRPVISASPLEVRNNYFIVALKESNDVDVVFDSYEISIFAEYKNASFVNYYIAHVDGGKNASRLFNLLNPIIIKGGTSQFVKIPFNSWVKAKIDEFDNWYMGSRLDYGIILKGDSISITLQ